MARGDRAHLARAAQTGMQAVLFDMSLPGYIWLGRVSQPEAHEAPRLLGLAHAWQILQAGALASQTLDARAFGCTGAQPGGALRARLREAAAWLDERCTEVASAIRAPYVTVGDGGAISCDRSTAPKVVLHFEQRHDT